MRPILLLIFAFISLAAFAGTIHEGKVIKIADGDTLTILVDKLQLKIRLSDIDTPERKQSFGTRAKQALSELAFGKQAHVIEVTKERYGRIVGRVYRSGPRNLDSALSEIFLGVQAANSGVTCS